VFLEKSLCQYLSEISLARKGDLMKLKEADLMGQNKHSKIGKIWDSNLLHENIIKYAIARSLDV
jgi:hypothetical protein